MRKPIIRILAGVFLFLSALSFSNVWAKGLRSAPDFELKDTHGRVYALSDLKGKNSALLLFWTSWCVFCGGELKELNKNYTNFLKDGIEVFAINSGETSEKVKGYVRNNGLSYKVLIDTEETATNSYGVFGVPTYVLIDKDGSIVFMDNYFPEMEYKELIAK